MDNNNWRSAQDQLTAPYSPRSQISGGGDVSAVTNVASPAVIDASDSRIQNQAYSRQRIVNEIEDVSELHQQSMLGTHSGNTSMQTNQTSMFKLQQSKAPMQNAMCLLPCQNQIAQQRSLQQMVSHIQSQPVSLIQMSQQSNSLLRESQQRLPASGSLLQPENFVERQKLLFQSKRANFDASSDSFDSTASRGNVSGGDWQEEVYQKSIMSEFPMDVLPDVLVRLPLQSLIRCRCVSKSWQDLIDSKEFIKLHLNRSILQLPEVSGEACSKSKFIRVAEMRPKMDWEYRTILYFADFDSQDKMKITLMDHKLGGRVRVCGSCNGLVCVSFAEFSASLWNPLTNRMWRIPYCPIGKVNGLRNGVSKLERDVYYFFGYDDTRDDYKVVRVIKFLDVSGKPLHQQFKVYSLKSNAWRNLPLPPELPYFLVFRGSTSGFLLNSSLHWIMSDRKHSADYSASSMTSDVIVALDLRTEKFHLIPPPPLACNPNREFGWDLTVFDGCLCVVLGPWDDLHLWIMKDYGRKDSWTRLLLKLPGRLFGLWSASDFYYFNPIAYSTRSKETLYKNEKDIWWYDIKEDSARASINSFDHQEDHQAEENDPPILLHSVLPDICAIYDFVGSLVNPCYGIDATCKEKKLRNKRARANSRDTTNTTPLGGTAISQNIEERKRKRKRADPGDTTNMTLLRRFARLQNIEERKKKRNK